MQRNSSLLGLIGLILLLFAGIAAVLTGASASVDIVYIAVNAGLGVFCLITYLSSGLDQVRDTLTERSTKYGANTVLGSAIFLGVLVLLNFLSTRYNHAFDMTEQGLYTLSSQSAQVVEGLEKELKVQAFVEGGINPQLRDLFEMYAERSDQVQFELIDPERQPHIAEEFSIRAYNSVRFSYGNESTVITEPTEQNITNAIIKVTRETQKKVCFIEGHGEADIDDTSARGLSSLETALENENYAVEKVLLATQESVPEDCSLVALVGPQRPFVESEIDALRAYLESGGRASVLLHPRSAPELSPMLAEWGVEVEDTVVVDQVLRLFQGPALGLTPLARQYAVHEITRDFKQITSFPMARSLKTDTAGKTGIQAVELVKTGESSWAETDLELLFTQNKASQDGGDRKGPLAVAVAVEADLAQQGKEGTARLVVFGSAQFADNREIEGTYYNRDLLLNSFGWLAGQADLVSIRPRSIRASRVNFTPQQSMVVFYLCVLIIPEILLLAGIAVWWRRE